jgi:hypothetical protein
MAVKFSDVQKILDAILAKSQWAQGVPPPLNPPTHGAFWRQTGNYDNDYTAFTTGNVPNIGVPIMNRTAGQELTSNFLKVLVYPNGLPDQGIAQMPGGPGGPYITDANYQVTVNGNPMTGAQIVFAFVSWLSNGFPK